MNEVVAEIGFGLGEYLGVGFYFYGLDAFGDPQYGGIVVHLGIGLGSPVYVGGSMGNNSSVRLW